MNGMRISFFFNIRCESFQQRLKARGKLEMEFNVFVVMMVCGLLLSGLVFLTYQSSTKGHAMKFAVASNVIVFFLIAALFEKSLAIKWGIPTATGRRR